ncbi:MAG: hypothetical protein EBU90_20655 [Proteobacteria bacterium]|nr:hypothetical protein [Pseudomonadota bacterium]NBP15461.1 hypothetical protein [bacterium]
MIIKFGADKSDAYASWINMKDVYVSRPFFKIVFNNGMGVYMLNNYKWNLLPRVSFQHSSSHTEFSIRWLKGCIEFQHNKAFAK